MGTSFGGNLDTAQHSCQFLSAAGWVEGVQFYLRRISREFGDAKMMLSLCSDLGKMGDTQNLPVLGERSQFLADNIGDPTADADIYLIIDARRCRSCPPCGRPASRASA